MKKKDSGEKKEEKKYIEKVKISAMETWAHGEHCHIHKSFHAAVIFSESERLFNVDKRASGVISIFIFYT